MAELIHIKEKEWSLEGDLRCARELEAGNILFFEKIPFPFPQDEIDFLLRQKQGGSKSRKNISYKPGLDKVSNHVSQDPKAREEMRKVLSNYSSRVVLFLSRVLSPYAEKWQVDYTSFRPFQEKGRRLRKRARNDLLHVDAFPTRPMHGTRILRFFTNINPTEARHWITSKPFAELATQFAGKKGLPFPRSNGYSLRDQLSRKAKQMLSSARIKIPLRSPYDVFMLRMHNFLKENEEFQATCVKDHWEFLPGCCWAVFTDQVSHAALSGQYALEQTVLVPPKALLFPDLAPVSILERLTRGNMIDPLGVVK